MKLACSSITFGELREEKDFVDVLQNVRNAGYEGLQVEHRFLPPNLRRKPKRTADLIQNSGLVTVAVAITADPRTVRFAEKMDCKIGTLCLFEEDHHSALRKAMRAAKLCHELGVTLAIHPHLQSNVETIDQLEEIIQKCEVYHPKLVFDSAHFAALRWDIPNFIKRFGKRIGIVHFKDLRTLRSSGEFNFRRDFVDIGDGVLDFHEVASALKEAKYSGWIVVEVDYPHEKTVFASIVKNRNRLAKMM